MNQQVRTQISLHLPLPPISFLFTTNFLNPVDFDSGRKSLSALSQGTERTAVPSTWTFWLVVPEGPGPDWVNVGATNLGED